LSPNCLQVVENTYGRRKVLSWHIKARYVVLRILDGLFIGLDVEQV
jgi:hypothetical protein